jgi:hypothetical protein
VQGAALHQRQEPDALHRVCKCTGTFARVSSQWPLHRAAAPHNRTWTAGGVLAEQHFRRRFTRGRLLHGERSFIPWVRIDNDRRPYVSRVAVGRSALARPQQPHSQPLPQPRWRAGMRMPISSGACAPVAAVALSRRWRHFASRRRRPRTPTHTHARALAVAAFARRPRPAVASGACVILASRKRTRRPGTHPGAHGTYSALCTRVSLDARVVGSGRGATRVIQPGDGSAATCLLVPWA